MTNTNLKPETAVWSEFLHRIGWSATYSRGCLVVHGQRPLLVVCSDGLGDGRLHKQVGFAERRGNGKEWTDDLLVVGAHPLPTVASYLESDPPAGLMGQRVSEGHVLDPLAPQNGPPRLIYQEAGWQWAPALWMRCDECGALGIYHETKSWTCRPCGHDVGPWHCGDANVAAIGETWAESAYAVGRRKSSRMKETSS